MDGQGADKLGPCARDAPERCGASITFYVSRLQCVLGYSFVIIFTIGIGIIVLIVLIARRVFNYSKNSNSKGLCMGERDTYIHIYTYLFTYT